MDVGARCAASVMVGEAGADIGGESTIPAHFCESERRESSAVEASGLRRKFKRSHGARGRAYSVDGTLGTG